MALCSGIKKSGYMISPFAHVIHAPGRLEAGYQFATFVSHSLFSYVTSGHDKVIVFRTQNTYLLQKYERLTKNLMNYTRQLSDIRDVNFTNHSSLNMPN